MQFLKRKFVLIVSFSVMLATLSWAADKIERDDTTSWRSSKKKCQEFPSIHKDENKEPRSRKKTSTRVKRHSNTIKKEEDCKSKSIDAGKKKVPSKKNNNIPPLNIPLKEKVTSGGTISDDEDSLTTKPSTPNSARSGAYNSFSYDCEEIPNESIEGCTTSFDSDDEGFNGHSSSE